MLGKKAQKHVVTGPGVQTLQGVRFNNDENPDPHGAGRPLHRRTRRSHLSGQQDGPDGENGAEAMEAVVHAPLKPEKSLLIPLPEKF